MSFKIFPTALNVGETSDVHMEEKITSWLNVYPRNFVGDGMHATDGGGLVVDVTAGKAMVEGYLVTVTATENVTVNASESDQYWYLQLTRDGSDHVNGTQWVRVLDAAIDGSDDPTDSVLVFECDADAVEVTDVKNSRQGGGIGCLFGSYTGDGTNSREIYDDNSMPPTWAIAHGLEATGYNHIYAFGNLAAAAWNRGWSGGPYTKGLGSSHDAGLASGAGSKRPSISHSGIFVDGGTLNELNYNGEEYYYLVLM